MFSFHVSFWGCMDVSENSGTPKSSILKGFSIVNHPFWGIPIFGNIRILPCFGVGSKTETSEVALAGYKYHRHGEGVAACHGDVGGLGGFCSCKPKDRIQIISFVWPDENCMYVFFHMLVSMSISIILHVWCIWMWICVYTFLSSISNRSMNTY